MENMLNKLSWRYIKFLDSLVKNKKPAVQALIKRKYKDARTTTGSNIRQILLETGIFVIPGETKSFTMNDQYVYKVPKGHEWKIGLLISLLEIKENNWIVQFDEENDVLSEDEVQMMIDDVCTS